VKGAPSRSEPRGTPGVAVLILSRLWRVPRLRPVQTARRAARAALAASEKKCMPDLTIALSDDAELRELNRIWRGKDRPTNVLAFPSVAAPVFGRLALGDIILAFERVSLEAEAAQMPLCDHLSNLVVHGVLHLLGMITRSRQRRGGWRIVK